MSRPRAVAVIPARMASSRYPGKPLAMISGLPMIEHVRRRSLLSSSIDEAVVATCDVEVMDAVAKAGGRAVMTSTAHSRCTTRVDEAMDQIEADIVVIVQGDEPLLRPDVIDAAVRPLGDRADLECTNVLSPVGGKADLDNPAIVKAVCDQRGYVMFFSRASIPFYQNSADCPVYRQMGIMAFRPAFLRQYTALPETPFERAESVDMLRLLEHGHRILGVPTGYLSIGVDHPADVAKVEAVLACDPDQRALHDRIRS
jgi:3-deoxy-manno-octulosonate cytidylyltransferase (CMP-KDO synthetase)